MGDAVCEVEKRGMKGVVSCLLVYCWIRLDAFSLKNSANENGSACLCARQEKQCVLAATAAG